MICKRCGGVMRTMVKESRDTGICGFCRGTTPKPLRRPRTKGGGHKYN